MDGFGDLNYKIIPWVCCLVCGLWAYIHEPYIREARNHIPATKWVVETCWTYSLLCSISRDMGRFLIAPVAIACSKMPRYHYGWWIGPWPTHGTCLSWASEVQVTLETKKPHADKSIPPMWWINGWATLEYENRVLWWSILYVYTRETTKCHRFIDIIVMVSLYLQILHLTK